jgi:hypothetical protein
MILSAPIGGGVKDNFSHKSSQPHRGIASDAPYSELSQTLELSLGSRARIGRPKFGENCLSGPICAIIPEKN